MQENSILLSQGAWGGGGREEGLLYWMDIWEGPITENQQPLISFFNRISLRKQEMCDIFVRLQNCDHHLIGSQLSGFRFRWFSSSNLTALDIHSPNLCAISRREKQTETQSEFDRLRRETKLTSSPLLASHNKRLMSSMAAVIGVLNEQYNILCVHNNYICPIKLD